MLRTQSGSLDEIAATAAHLLGGTRDTEILVVGLLSGVISSHNNNRSSSIRNFEEIHSCRVTRSINGNEWTFNCGAERETFVVLREDKVFHLIWRETGESLNNAVRLRRTITVDVALNIGDIEWILRANGPLAVVHAAIRASQYLDEKRLAELVAFGPPSATSRAVLQIIQLGDRLKAAYEVADAKRKKETV